MDLDEVVYRFFQARMQLSRKKESIERTSFGLRVGSRSVVVAPRLSEAAIDPHSVISTLNSDINIDYLIEHFDLFCVPGCTVLFFHPPSHSHWKIIPSAHKLFSDSASFESGIRSLSSSIEKV